MAESEADAYPAPSSNVVIDAVVHGYNLLPSNARNDAARSFVQATYGMVSLTGHRGFIGPAEYSRDWGIEELAQLLFVESDVDLATFHAVPLDDYFYDGMVSNEKGIEMRRRWPDRVLFYGAVNALQDPVQVLEHAQYLVDDAGAVGIKLYPERYQEGSTVPVDLASSACEPLLEWASEHSVVLAIHKIFPAGVGRTEHYRLGDVEAAAARFPKLQLEVVHSGMAFLDETFFLLQRFENVWGEPRGDFCARGQGTSSVRRGAWKALVDGRPGPRRVRFWPPPRSSAADHRSTRRLRDARRPLRGLRVSAGVPRGRSPSCSGETTPGSTGSTWTRSAGRPPATSSRSSELQQDAGRSHGAECEAAHLGRDPSEPDVRY